MYPNPYRTTEQAYTGQSTLADHCPICGATGDCPDGAVVAMPYPPVDFPADGEPEAAAPLHVYDVTVRGFTTVMRLTEFDAARYGDAAVLRPIGEL